MTPKVPKFISKTARKAAEKISSLGESGRDIYLATKKKLVKQSKIESDSVESESDKIISSAGAENHKQEVFQEELPKSRSSKKKIKSEQEELDEALRECYDDAKRIWQLIKRYVDQKFDS